MNALLLLALALIAPIVGFGAYLWAIGRRTIRTQTFPPSGVAVLRGTRVVSGAPAVTRGRMLQLLGLLLVLAGGGLAALFWRLDSMLRR